MTSIEQELGNEIFKAVGQIVAASHAAATKAIDEAFARKRLTTRTGGSTSSREAVGQYVLLVTIVENV